MIDVENEALQATIDSAAVGETLMLTGNVTLTDVVIVSKDITVDLNGYAITSNTDIFKVTCANLTLKNGVLSTNGDGCCIVWSTNKGSDGYLNNIVFEDVTATTTSHAVVYHNGVQYGINLTVKDSNFKSNDICIYLAGNNAFGSKKNLLTIENSSISGTSAVEVKQCDVSVTNSTLTSTSKTVSMTENNNGSCSSGYALALANSNDASVGNVSINSGTFIGEVGVQNAPVGMPNVKNYDVTIYGGAFSNAVNEEYFADGVELVYEPVSGVYLTYNDNNTAASGNGLKVIATSSSRIRDLVIKDGQLVFIQDLGRIAFDFNGKRVFYNQIVNLNTEAERLSIESPLGGYYFVIGSAALWFYDDKWIQITGASQDIVFIGAELPELGQAKTGTLYVNKAKKEISVWDEETNTYIAVADKTGEIDTSIDTVTEDDINSLF